jgi:hypothetical protein
MRLLLYVNNTLMCKGEVKPFPNDSISLDKPSHCSLFIAGFAVNVAVFGGSFLDPMIWAN